MSGPPRGSRLAAWESFWFIRSVVIRASDVTLCCDIPMVFGPFLTFVHRVIGHAAGTRLLAALHTGRLRFGATRDDQSQREGCSLTVVLLADIHGFTRGYLLHNFLKVLADDRGGLEVVAGEPHMFTEHVPSTPVTEFTIMGQEDGSLLVCEN